jgi:hypothetical protein
MTGAERNKREQSVGLYYVSRIIGGTGLSMKPNPVANGERGGSVRNKITKILFLLPRKKIIFVYVGAKFEI